MKPSLRDQLLADLGAAPPVMAPAAADDPAMVFVNGGLVIPPYGVEIVPAEPAPELLLAIPKPYLMGTRFEGWVTERQPFSGRYERLYRLAAGTRIQMVAPDGRSITTVTG